MIKTLSRRTAAVVLALTLAQAATLAYSPLARAKNSEIKQTMNDMKRAYNGALNSATLADFARYAGQLQAGADEAGRMTFKDDPDTYRQGMQQLQQQLALVNKAVAAGNLAGAKEALHQVNVAKKHYHDLLN